MENMRDVLERMDRLLERDGCDIRSDKHRVSFGYTPEEAEAEIRRIQRSPKEFYTMEDGAGYVLRDYTKSEMIDLIRRNIRR